MHRKKSDSPEGQLMDKRLSRAFPFAALACLLTSVAWPQARNVARAPIANNTGIWAAYQPIDENFPNPERGFYYQTSYQPRAGYRPPALNAVALRKWRDSGITLVRMYYVFSEYREAPLAPSMLERIEADLGAVRAAGMKMIPRFTYNFGPTGAPDASAKLILEHLDQLSQTLVANQDVIAFLEAGFIGTWGEWHDSTNGLFDPIPGVWWQRVNSLSRAIVNKLLEVLPSGRMVALRYPRHKMDISGPEPLAESEAFNETPKARIGAHNDCFLASKNDWGTYSTNIASEKQFYRQDNLFVPQGGETCNAQVDAQPFVGCENALRELDELHFNTLNYDYHKDVLGGWRAAGCMPEIERRLGYRFRLVDSEAPAAAAPGGEIRLAFTIVNEGFGNLYNKRPLVVVLRPKAGGESILLATGEDPRRWMTGRETAVRIAANIPEAAAIGEYEVLLWLPDLAASLQDRPEYAVRLANAGVWEPASGMNRLAHVVTVE